MNFRNLYPYLKERFPLVNMALFAILFLTVYSVAKFYNPLVPFNFTESGILGIFAVIFFFFRLRVFDEIKDYLLDEVNHPQRVLQSGRITLKELKALAAVGVIIEIAWSLKLGIPCFVAWIVALAFSLLMRYEFFIAGFLKKRLLLYAITHMLIMPLIILWIWKAYSPVIGEGYCLLALLSLAGGFSFEIARKIHTPDAERNTVDSYSKSIGLTTSVITVLLILLAGITVLSYLLIRVEASSWVFILYSFYLSAGLAKNA